MSNPPHQNTVLVHPSTGMGPNDSRVVAYFAPSFEVNVEDKNNIHSEEMPRDKDAIARDIRQIRTEITIQGEFLHSDELPEQHQQDLQNLFGAVTVTARDQIRRIRAYMHRVGGPFELVDRGDGYTDQYIAQDSENVDWENGIYPTVQMDLIRPAAHAGIDREEYTVKLIVGLERP